MLIWCNSWFIFLEMRLLFFNDSLNFCIVGRKWCNVARAFGYRCQLPQDFSEALGCHPDTTGSGAWTTAFWVVNIHLLYYARTICKRIVHLYMPVFVYMSTCALFDLRSFVDVFHVAAEYFVHVPFLNRRFTRFIGCFGWWNWDAGEY